MTHILALAGRKSAGKTTAAQWLQYHQYQFFGESCTPHVKIYNFADPLKKLCMDLFGLTWAQCYGCEEDKTTFTQLLWENFPSIVAREVRQGPMTAREVLQYVGSDIFRRMAPDCWVNATLRKIAEDAPTLAVVADCRFPNEVSGVQKAGGKAVLLTRSPYSDGHASENSLPPATEFDAVIDNANEALSWTHGKLLSAITRWNWLTKKA